MRYVMRGSYVRRLGGVESDSNDFSCFGSTGVL